LMSLGRMMSGSYSRDFIRLSFPVEWREIISDSDVISHTGAERLRLLGYGRSARVTATFVCKVSVTR
jgi:hypothetical protein